MEYFYIMVYDKHNRIAVFARSFLQSSQEVFLDHKPKGQVTDKF